MTIAASGSRLRGLRGVWLPALLVASIFLSLVGVVVLSQRVGNSGEPPDPPTFAGPQAPPITVMDVKERSGDSLTLVDRDGVEVSFVANTGVAVERLRPVEARDIALGDTISVVGIPNEVLSFSIHFIVVMDAPAATVEGIARSAGGFAGHEAALDRADRPLLSGVVETVAEAGNLLTFRGPDGPATLRLNESEPARIYRIEQVEASTIAEGERVAANFSAAPVAALLVMPPGT